MNTLGEFLTKINECILNSIPDASDPEKIGMEGVVKLLEDLHLDPGSRIVLLFAWKLQAATQCEFTHQEFINGLTELG